MLLIGKKQILTITSKSKFGMYLCKDSDKHDERVLLPNNEITDEMQVGDQVQVYVYKDSEDRIICTTKFPPMEIGDTCMLKVKEVTQIGAFLEWGLSKDLFLPFKEQNKDLKPGQSVLVALYLDKSSRLCATMKVYPYLDLDSPYKKDDKVTGTVYDIIENFGAYVAVDNKYSAMIPRHELFCDLKPGDMITARITKVKEDGRLDLSIREKASVAMDSDSLAIYKELMKSGGFLPLNDKSSPEEIMKYFHLSKNAFKRAIGHLYKEQKIIITKNGIETAEYSGNH